MSVFKFIVYLAMFIIKEILNFKIYINNLFILIKKLKKPYQFFFKNKILEIFSDKNMHVVYIQYKNNQYYLMVSMFYLLFCFNHICLFYGFGFDWFCGVR
jgi:hypothetical protein